MLTQSAFWNFSLHHYANKNIQQACLNLQDACNADVNMMLFCCWFAERQGVIPLPLFSKLVTFSLQWQSNVTTPLRQIRRWLKTNSLDCDETDQSDDGSKALRAAVKENELQAEKTQQLFLESESQFSFENTKKLGIYDNSQKSSACVENLLQYFNLALITIKNETRSDIQNNLAILVNDIFKLTGDDAILPDRLTI